MWLQMLRPGERGTGIGSSVEGVREILFTCVAADVEARRKGYRYRI